MLDAFVENELIKKVKTEKDIMRYDAIIENHHHIYCSDSDRIEDYNDMELNEMLEKYFEKKKNTDFEIEDIKLQIIGKNIYQKIKTMYPVTIRLICARFMHLNKLIIKNIKN